MKIHILGICGTFMGGVAALARERGDQVEGSDQNVYPPMSTQLGQLGIALKSGYAAAHIGEGCDEIVVGNALSRGNPAVEHVLNQEMRYTSGAQWLAERILPGRTTLAVAGTHGKTTTSSMLAWLLEAAGRDPGFLIGGVPQNFGVSARLGKGDAFVVEADEYDTAFFDKRSKFVHYRPKIAVLNNLEYDHADIFPDLDAIKRQFHHLVRTVPGNGRLIVNAEDENLEEVLGMGAWTPIERFAIDTDADWTGRLASPDGSRFEVLHRGESAGSVAWDLIGRHNVMNALAAIAAASSVGVPAAQSVQALAGFASARRRLERVAEVAGVTVYDDFAHHPTAIRTTLDGVRARVGNARVIAVMEPRSNSMRLGAHADALAPSLQPADVVYFLARPELAWDAGKVIAGLRGSGDACGSVDALLTTLAGRVRAGDHVVFMSNGGFDGAVQRFVAELRGRADE